MYFTESRYFNSFHIWLWLSHQVIYPTCMCTHTHGHTHTPPHPLIGRGSQCIFSWDAIHPALICTLPCQDSIPETMSSLVNSAPWYHFGNPQLIWHAAYPGRTPNQNWEETILGREFNIFHQGSNSQSWWNIRILLENLKEILMSSLYPRLIIPESGSVGPRQPPGDSRVQPSFKNLISFLKQYENLFSLIRILGVGFQKEGLFGLCKIGNPLFNLTHLHIVCLKTNTCIAL